jgi:hypothetical protein
VTAAQSITTRGPALRGGASVAGMRILLAVPVLAFALTPWAAADSSLEEARDHNVHVWAPDKAEGRLVAFDDQTVTLRPATGPVRVFDRSAIEKMEVARGAGFHVGMAFAGAGAGLLTALAAGYSACDAGGPDACEDASWGKVGAIAAGGAAAGALIVGLATKNVGWHDVNGFRRKVTTAVSPSPRGLGLSLSVRF